LDDMGVSKLSAKVFDPRVHMIITTFFRNI